MKKYPKILYFIKGSMPSDDDFKNAESFGVNVSFRNALFITDVGTLEHCDGVTGVVPEKYANEFNTAEAAIAAFKKQYESFAKKPTNSKVEEIEEVEKNISDKNVAWKAN